MYNMHRLRERYKILQTFKSAEQNWFWLRLLEVLSSRARQSAVEVCGEAVHRPKGETVCDQEWKDTAIAVLSS